MFRTLKLVAFTVALLSLMVGGTARAQDTALTPDAAPERFTLSVAGGFVPDPLLFSVLGGGTVAASTAGQGCVGFVTANPTVVLNWKTPADKAAPLLRIFTFSDYDTTLTVQLPNGSYVCNDNATRVVRDASIDVPSPGDGRYAIWVGGVNSGQRAPVFLGMTNNPDIHTSQLELDKLVRRPSYPPLKELEQTADKALKLDAKPSAGVIEYKPGDGKVSTDIKTGADTSLDLDLSKAGCLGFISSTPTVAVNLTGSADIVRFLFSSVQPSSLVVRAPNGTYYCSENYTEKLDINPLVDIPNPANGQYLLFVGSFDKATPAQGNLTVVAANKAIQPVPAATPAK